MTQQSMEALQRANDIRLGRAMIKKEIKEEKVSVVDVLETEPYVCDGMTVLQLFTCKKGWAARRTEKFLKGTVTNVHKHLGRLTTGEREQLIERYKQSYE